MNKIPIVEIFGPTIQGEGELAGTPVIFVRTAGCDNKCIFCDTQKAQKVEAGDLLKENELIEILKKMIHDTHTEAIVFTGGNPCMWDLTKTIQKLRDWNIKIFVETQGTLNPDWLDLADMITISPKTPSSGNVTPVETFYKIIEERYMSNVHVKIVIDPKEESDWEYLNKAAEVTNQVIIQPKDNMTEPYTAESYNNRYRDLVEEYLKRYEEGKVPVVKVLPQLHKVAWGRKEGV